MKKFLILYLAIIQSLALYSQENQTQSLAPLKDTPLKDTVMKSNKSTLQPSSQNPSPPPFVTPPTPTSNNSPKDPIGASTLKSLLKQDKKLAIYADTVDLLECKDQDILYGVVNSQKAKHDIEEKVKSLGLQGEIENKIIIK